MKSLHRLLPSPLLSAALFALWLTLNDSVDPAQLLLAAALALLLPLLAAPLRTEPARLRRPLVLLRLVMTVGRDLVVSNLSVARGVLRRRGRRAAFVSVPLDLRDSRGLAALAVITTVVPGTIWSELAHDRSTLLLHLFEVGDEAAFVAHFKRRYEQPLREIFE